MSASLFRQDNRGGLMNKMPRKTPPFIPLSWSVEKFNAALASFIPVSIGGVALYEIGYFKAILVDLRSVPLTIVDYTLDVMRILPIIAAILIGCFSVYFATQSFFPRITEEAFKSSQKASPRSTTLRYPRRNTRPNRDLPSDKLDFSVQGVIYFSIVMLFFCGGLMSFAFGPATAAHTANPVDAVIIAMGGIASLMVFAVLLMRFWPLRVILIPVLFIFACIIIWLWGGYTSLTQYEHAQRAVIKYGDEGESVRIVGSYEKGILISDKDGLRFIIWDGISSLKYEEANPADILQPWLDGPKVDYDNPLRKPKPQVSTSPPSIAHKSVQDVTSAEASEISQ
jgi:hypothetical protein